MHCTPSLVLATILCLAPALITSTAAPQEKATVPRLRIRDFSPEPCSLVALGIGPFELEAKVKEVLALPSPKDWSPTGIDRNYYLDVMEHVLREAQKWVDAQGKVIDPIRKKEVGQTTPRLVSSGAVLLGFGRLAEAREAVFRSMSHCCQALPSGQAKKNSPDFWMRELMTAYLALQNVADREQLAAWAAGISAVEPEKIYTKVSPSGKGIDKLANWAIYASAGEAMRQAAGLKPAKDFLWGNAFLEKYVGGQFSLWTANGMYRDPGDPITYDITTRLQVASALAYGYDGKLRQPLEELLRRGGLAMLLFMSPEGFVPYGGRSAAFNFREAIVCALAELEARRYRQSDPKLAGAFKRQAHLSALAVKRWMRDMEPWRHLQNGFPPEASHGLDSYGHYSVYSLLCSSFLGLAAIYADDTIAEAPCPADKGGFVFALAPAFHKVFANVGGTYLEIDTGADLHYDATGLGRFCRKGVPLELALGMPAARFMKKWGQAAITMGPGQAQPDEPVAIGPGVWTGRQWWSLAAEPEGKVAHTLKVLHQAPEAVEFEVVYTCSNDRTITERYRLEPGKLAIACANGRQGEGRAAERVRMVVPLLVTDGFSKSQIEGPADGVVQVKYLGHIYRVQFDRAMKATIEEKPYANRNAVYRSLLIESPGNGVQVTLELQ